MSKYLIYLEVLLLILIDSIKASQPYKCVHDQVKLPTVPVGTITYQEINKKRHARHEDRYQPLKINSYIDDIDPILSADVVQTVDYALKSMTQFFSETIKVERSFNPFLLERTSCIQKWKHGKNRGACSQIKFGPEFCSMHETDYVIDQRFLNGLDLYDDEIEEPILSLPKGEGVRDVNFFLFVTSRSSSWCKKDGVQAYGSYCRLDSKNRPVAGLINLCPLYFSKKFHSKNYYQNVILHEMMHILGFSSHLYPKFRHCVQDNVCHSPKKFVTTDKHGIQRLVLPEVVTAMQLHLNCSDEDLGGPLEKTDSKIYSSHWHPLLMYTSIMTPVMLEQDFTVMDNISMSVLSSTGWYQVNYKRAQSFTFGKNEGCDFGFKEKCEDSSHLCTTGTGASGCDLLHFTIGRCEELTPTHSCGVYRYNSSNRCSDMVGSFRGINIRNSYHEHRCIMRQNLNDTEERQVEPHYSPCKLNWRLITMAMTWKCNRNSNALPWCRTINFIYTDYNFEPTCLLIKCRQHKSIDLYLNSTWVPCEPDTLVTAGNITAKCLHQYAICKAPPARTSRCIYEEDLALTIRIYMTDPSFEEISEHSNFHDFKGSTLKAIALILNIPVNYIVNSTMVIFKTVYLEFGICPPEELSREEFNRLIRNIQHFLKATSFGYIFHFNGFLNLPVSSTQYTIKPSIAIQFSDHDGFSFVAVIPTVCCIFVLASIVASLFRYYFIKRRQAWRESVGKVQMSDLNQSSSVDDH